MNNKDSEQPTANKLAMTKLQIEVIDFEGPYEELDDSVVFTRSTTTSCSTS